MMTRMLPLLPLLVACTPLRLVTPDEPPVDAFSEAPYGWGKICVLRPHSLGFALMAPIRDNGQLVGATRGPSYFCYLVPPGPHRVTAHVGRTAAAEVLPPRLRRPRSRLPRLRDHQPPGLCALRQLLQLLDRRPLLAERLRPG
jgi:hypothetical protein